MRSFYSVVENYPRNGLINEQLRLRCFPYTLKDRASAWWLAIPAGTLTSWSEIYEKFMAKFYSHTKTMNLRQLICTFVKGDDEPFHEAWDRFKALKSQCPHHYYPRELLNQFFYDGLNITTQYMVDGAAGKNIGEYTAEEATNLFEILGENL